MRHGRSRMRCAAMGLALLGTGCAAAERPLTIGAECSVFRPPVYEAGEVDGWSDGHALWVAETYRKGIEICGWE